MLIHEIVRNCITIAVKLLVIWRPGLGFLPSVGFTPDLFIGVKASYNLTHVLGTQDIATVTAGRINANRYAYWDLKSKNKTTPELFFLVN